MKRNILLSVLIIVLVCSAICLVACHLPNDEILCVYTSPDTHIYLSDGTNIIQIYVTDLEMIVHDDANNTLVGHVNLELKVDNQLADKISIAFATRGNSMLIETRYMSSKYVSYQQLNAEELLESLQGNLDGEFLPSDDDTNSNQEKLQQLQTVLEPIVDILQKSFDEYSNKAVVSIVKTFFDKAKGFGGKYAFNVDKIHQFNEDLYKLSLNEVLCKYAGKGDKQYVDNIKAEFSNLLQKPMEGILVKLEDDGITTEMIAQLADAFVAVMSDNQFATLAEMLGKSSTLEYLNSNEFTQLTLKAFLANLGLNIDNSAVDALFAQLDNTLYQLMSPDGDNGQLIYEQMTQLLDSVDKIFDLSVVIKNNKIKWADVTLDIRDIPMDASVSGVEQVLEMDIYSNIIVDADKKKTSDYNYTSLVEKWDDPSRIVNEILRRKGYEVDGKQMPLSETEYHELKGYYDESNTTPFINNMTGIIVDGYYSQLTTIMPVRLEEYQTQEICNNATLYTFRYLFQVYTRQNGWYNYKHVSSISKEYGSTGFHDETYEKIMELYAYIDNETGEIFYLEDPMDIYKVHGKENIIYDGDIVKCSQCNSQMQCDHKDMRIANISLNNAKDCADGSTITESCPNCGFSEQYQSNEHIVSYKVVESIPTDGYCNPTYMLAECPCGTIRYADLSTGCDFIYSTITHYIDQDGISHTYTLDRCYRCELRMERDTWQVYDGCVATNYQIATISYHHDIIVENYSGVASFSQEHQLQISYQDDNSDCSDGYTILEQCENCDYQNSYWSIGHILSVDYNPNSIPNCTDGIQRTELCAVCGKTDLQTTLRAHDQISTDVVSNSQRHSVVVQYCACGNNVTLGFPGEHLVNKTITADMIEISYQIIGSNLKIYDIYKCISLADGLYQRQIVVCDGDELLYEKIFHLQIDHVCKEFDLWRDTGSAFVCSNGCHILYLKSMHQYYTDLFAEATAGIDVCQGHSTFFCFCQSCENSQLELRELDPGEPGFLSKYFNFDCPKCGLVFKIETSSNCYNNGLDLSRMNFSHVNSVYVIFNNEIILNINSNTFREFGQY